MVGLVSQVCDKFERINNKSWNQIKSIYLRSSQCFTIPMDKVPPKKVTSYCLWLFWFGLWNLMTLQNSVYRLLCPHFSLHSEEIFIVAALNGRTSYAGSPFFSGLRSLLLWYLCDWIGSLHVLFIALSFSQSTNNLLNVERFEIAKETKERKTSFLCIVWRK